MTLLHKLAAACCVLVILATGSALFADVYSDAVLSNSPLAYWRLSEATTGSTAVNLGSLGASANGSYTAGTLMNQTGLAGVPNSAVAFNNASNDRMSTAGFEKFSGGGGYTVEFWTQFNSAPTGFMNLVGDGEGSGDFNLMVYGMAGGGIRAHAQTNTGATGVDVPALSLNQRHHVVSTWNSTTGAMSVYVDGVLRGVGQRTGTPSNTNNPIYVGTDIRQAPTTANVVLDEAAIYNQPLTRRQIATHASAGGLAVAPLSVSLSTDVLNAGNPLPMSFADGYNNNAQGSTVELVRFIGNSDSSPINVAYNQAGNTIDVSQFVVSGAARGAAQGLKSNGYTTGNAAPAVSDNLYLRGQANQFNEGFGAHANWIITYDLNDIRTAHLEGFNGALNLAGEFGAWGGIGSADPTAGVVQGAIFLDGVRIDSMLETIANPAAANQAFNLNITSGRYLTFAIFNGDGTADSTLWDDGLFKNVRLTAVLPEPSTVVMWLLVSVVGVVAVVRRRQR